jgi:hypothetical protein
VASQEGLNSIDLISSTIIFLTIFVDLNTLLDCDVGCLVGKD